MSPSKRRKKITDSYDSTRPFLIDSILPAHCLHLLGGPSGAGKTRWLFDLLRNWSQGNSLFGFSSHPCEWVYIATDREYASVCDTMRELEIDPETIDIFPAFNLEPKEGFEIAGIDWLFKKVKEAYPSAKLWIIETIGAYVPGGKVNDYATVGKFLRALGRQAHKNGITLIATHHTAKQKGKDKYENPREQLMGSGGWGGFTETTFIMDFAEPDNPASPYRALTIMPRNGAPNVKFAYKFDKQGRLSQCSPDEIPRTLRGRPRDSQVREAFNSYFETLGKKGIDTFKLADIVDALQSKVSRPTVVRRLEELCEEGTLERKARGTYHLSGLKDTAQFEGVLL